MKATRDQLKSLVKELLLEILQEGLGAQQGVPRPVVPEGRKRVPQQGGRQRPTFDPRLDTPLAGGRQPTDLLKEAVRVEAAGNPVLADILADTAMTTLPTQLSHGDSMGRPSPGGAAPALAQQEQFHGDPSEIFAGGEVRNDGSSHWADLAFMPGKKPL